MKAGSKGTIDSAFAPEIEPGALMVRALIVGRQSHRDLRLIHLLCSSSLKSTKDG